VFSEEVVKMGSFRKAGKPGLPLRNYPELELKSESVSSGIQFNNGSGLPERKGENQ
jgi:hypothetical protein